MARTSAARYYFRIDTYWTNSPDYFIGPFDTRDVAQAEIDSIQDKYGYCLSANMCGNVKDFWRVYDVVLTATEAKRMGMRDDYSSRHNLISNTLPNNSADIVDMITGE